MSTHIRFRTLNEFDLAVIRLAVGDVVRSINVRARVYTMSLDTPGLYVEFADECDFILFALLWDSSPYTVIE